MRTAVFALILASALASPTLAHGGGLNACGCHFNRKTGECHCHRWRGCGCDCEPAECSRVKALVGEAPAGHARSVEDKEPEPLSGSCGIERWNVKTMSDAAAKGIHRQKPRTATVEQLASMPAPPWSARAPRSAAEMLIYSVDGCIAAYALEADSDLHVVLQGQTGATMIVEFPDAANCAPWSHAPGLMENARKAFLQLAPERPSSTFRYLHEPMPVTVVGPLFMDKVHGQEGVAPNGAEIHPVLRLRHRAGNCR